MTGVRGTRDQKPVRKELKCSTEGEIWQGCHCTQEPSFLKARKVRDQELPHKEATDDPVIITHILLIQVSWNGKNEAEQDTMVLARPLA